jgi:hypothetical protein
MNILDVTQAPMPFAESESQQLAPELTQLTGAQAYPRSITANARGIYFLARQQNNKRLAILSDAEMDWAGFHGEQSTRYDNSRAFRLLLCPLDSQNAAALRATLPWLQPQVLGLKKSVGLGDRLGLATPGHVRAVRACGTGIAPIFAQQSIREMTRTHRTPQQVLDDAMWGVFQEGWRAGYGADADHLKTTEDIDSVVNLGYTFFTFDPGASVDDDGELSERKLNELPWNELETTFIDLRARYLGRRFDFEHHQLEFDDARVRAAVIKYGRAIAHVTRLYRHLKSLMRGRDVEIEISVDETATPTSPAEHFIVAGELRRLGVEWVSLAPRFVGRFEKGVDYIGDLDAFANDFGAHMDVARHWGPYKLSLHSGSDKFSIYPIAARLAGDRVHLKTAGTSYLEALRTIAQIDAVLSRNIYALARERYPEERTSYHVSAELTRAPRAEELSDTALVTLLNQFDARQILHVCFGSILAQYGEEIRAVLAEHEEAYATNLETHLARHLESFCR